MQIRPHLLAIDPGQASGVLLRDVLLCGAYDVSLLHSSPERAERFAGVDLVLIQPPFARPVAYTLCFTIGLLAPCRLLIVTSDQGLPAELRKRLHAPVSLLVSPFPPEELLARVQELLEAEQARRHSWREVSPGSNPAVLSLTATEEEILAALLEGRSNREIAAERHVQERAIQAHVSRLMAKCGVKSRAQMVALVRDGRVICLREPRVARS